MVVEPAGRRACPLCASASHRVRFSGGDRYLQTTDETFTVVECTACGMTYTLEEQPDPGRYYPPDYWWRAGRDEREPTLLSRAESLYRELVLRAHLRYVGSRLGRRGATILDIGTGGGEFLAMCRGAGMRVWGLDDGEPAVAAARGQGLENVFCGHTPADIPPEVRPVAGWDFITLFHLLEHVSEPLGLLEAVRPHLIRGTGRIVVQVPNRASWAARIWGRRWNAWDLPRHQNHFTPQTLTRALEQSGYQVRRLFHHSLRDAAPGWASSLAPGLVPMRLVHQGAGDARRIAAEGAYLALTMALQPVAALETIARAGSIITAVALPHE